MEYRSGLPAGYLSGPSPATQPPPPAAFTTTPNVPPPGQRSQICLIYRDKHDPSIAAGLDFYSLAEAREWLQQQLEFLDRAESEQQWLSPPDQ